MTSEERNRFINIFENEILLKINKLIEETEKVK